MTEDLGRLTVLAIDPGKMTGWATWWCGSFSAGQDDRDHFLPRVEVFLRAARSGGVDPHIAIERFVIGPATLKNSQQTDALEIIGAVKYIATLHKATVDMQTPADAKRFATDARLKRLELYKGSKFDHANDATRHLVVWLARHGWEPPGL